MNRRHFLQCAPLAPALPAVFSHFDAFSQEEQNHTNFRPNEAIFLKANGNLAYIKTGSPMPEIILPCNTSMVFPSGEFWQLEKNMICISPFSQPQFNSNHVLLMKTNWDVLQVAIFKFQNEELTPVTLLTNETDIYDGYQLGVHWNIISAFCHNDFPGELSVALYKDQKLVIVNISADGKTRCVFDSREAEDPFWTNLPQTARLVFIPNGTKPMLGVMIQKQGIFLYGFENQRFVLHSQITADINLWDTDGQRSVALNGTEIRDFGPQKLPQENPPFNDTTVNDVFGSANIDGNFFLLLSDSEKHLVSLKYNPGEKDYVFADHTQTFDEELKLVEWAFFHDAPTPYLIFLGGEKGQIISLTGDGLLNVKNLRYNGFEPQKYIKIMNQRRLVDTNTDGTYFRFSCIADDRAYDLQVDVHGEEWELYVAKEHTVAQLLTLTQNEKKESSQPQLGMNGDNDDDSFLGNMFGKAQQFFRSAATPAGGKTGQTPTGITPASPLTDSSFVVVPTPTEPTADNPTPTSYDVHRTSTNLGASTGQPPGVIDGYANNRSFYLYPKDIEMHLSDKLDALSKFEKQFPFSEYCKKLRNDLVQYSNDNLTILNAAIKKNKTSPERINEFCTNQIRIISRMVENIKSVAILQERISSEELGQLSLYKPEHATAATQTDNILASLKNEGTSMSPKVLVCDILHHCSYDPHSPVPYRGPNRPEKAPFDPGLDLAIIRFRKACLIIEMSSLFGGF